MEYQVQVNSYEEQMPVKDVARTLDILGENFRDSCPLSITSHDGVLKKKEKSPVIGGEMSHDAAIIMRTRGTSPTTSLLILYIYFHMVLKVVIQEILLSYYDDISSASSGA